MGTDETYNRDLNTRIKMTFGTTNAAYDLSLDKQEKGLEIESIIVHPDYWEDKTKHGQSYDLALIHTTKVGVNSRTLLSNPLCRKFTLEMVTW